MQETIRNSRIFAFLCKVCRVLITWWQAGAIYGFGSWLKKHFSGSATERVWLWLGNGPVHVENSSYARFMHWLRSLVEKCGSWLSHSLCCRLILWVGETAKKITKNSFVGKLEFRQWVLVVFGLYLPVEYIIRDTLQLSLISSVWEEAFILLAAGIILWRRALQKTDALNRETPLDAWFFLFWGVGLLLMSVVSPDMAVAFAGYRIVVTYMVWFFLIVRLVETEDDFRLLYSTFALLIGALAFHGIYQFVVGVDIPDHWTTSTESAVRTRVFSLTGSPNILGDMLVLFSPLWAAGIYYTRRPWQKVACLAMTCFCLMALLFTFSRGAWLGMILTIVVFALFIDRRLIAMMLAAMAGVLIFVPSITSRLTFLMTEEYAIASAAGGRAMRWELGRYLLSLCNKWFGFGLGRYGGAVAMQNQTLDITEYITGYFYMDNYYLKTMVEMGYIGLIAFLLLIAAFVFIGLRAILRSDRSFNSLPGDPLVRCIGNRRVLAVGVYSGMLGVLIHCLYENIFEEPYMTAYFWGMAALLLFLGYFRKK